MPRAHHMGRCEMTRTEKRLLKLVNERQRTIRLIASLERQHKNASEQRAWLSRITTEELKAINRRDRVA